MSYDAEGFRSFFLNVVGASRGTSNTYNSFLGRIDRTLSGLDEALTRDGPDDLLLWARDTREPPFDVYRSSAKAVLKRYIGFKTNRSEFNDEIEVVESADVDPQASIFSVEREMQVAVRKQLGRLESGLVEADGGIERQVVTGRIDILARDAEGKYVVVELKAGKCPSGAIEQVLGYAQALEDETGEHARAILVASEFSDRMMSAAKRVRDLKLVEYQYALSFSEARGA